MRSQNLFPKALTHLLLLVALAALAQQAAHGQVTVLHSFTGLDGANPQSTLVRDSAGNLYGTTSYGGGLNLGTVFKLDSSGNNFQLLYSFTGQDGAHPFAGLVLDQAGHLYGTANQGGAFNVGTVPSKRFKLHGWPPIRRRRLTTFRW